MKTEIIAYNNGLSVKFSIGNQSFTLAPVQDIEDATFLQHQLEQAFKLNVIKAKALRKKGTDKWYMFTIKTKWIECEYPKTLPLETTGMEMFDLPSDSELVDLEIRVIEHNK